MSESSKYERPTEILMAVAQESYTATHADQLSYNRDQWIQILRQYYDKDFKLVSYGQMCERNVDATSVAQGYFDIQKFKIQRITREFTDVYQLLDATRYHLKQLVVLQKLMGDSKFEKLRSDLKSRSVRVKVDDKFKSLFDYLKFHRRMHLEVQVHEQCQTSDNHISIVNLYSQHMNEFSRQTLRFTRNYAEYKQVATKHNDIPCLAEAIENAFMFVTKACRIMSDLMANNADQVFVMHDHKRALITVQDEFRKVADCQKGVLDCNPKMAEWEIQEHMESLEQFGGERPFYWTRGIAHTKLGENIEYFVYLFERKLSFWLSRRNRDADAKGSSTFYCMDRFSVKLCDEERITDIEHRENNGIILTEARLPLVLVRTDNGPTIFPKYGLGKAYNKQSTFLVMGSYDRDEDNLLLEFPNKNEYLGFKDVYKLVSRNECSRVNKKLMEELSSNLPQYMIVLKKLSEKKDNLMDVVYTARDSVRKDEIGKSPGDLSARYKKITIQKVVTPKKEQLEQVVPVYLEMPGLEKRYGDIVLQIDNQIHGKKQDKSLIQEFDKEYEKAKLNREKQDVEEEFEKAKLTRQLFYEQQKSTEPVSEVSKQVRQDSTKKKVTKVKSIKRVKSIKKVTTRAKKWAPVNVCQMQKATVGNLPRFNRPTSLAEINIGEAGELMARINEFSFSTLKKKPEVDSKKECRQISDLDEGLSYKKEFGLDEMLNSPKTSPLQRQSPVKPQGKYNLQINESPQKEITLTLQKKRMKAIEKIEQQEVGSESVDSLINDDNAKGVKEMNKKWNIRTTHQGRRKD